MKITELDINKIKPYGKNAKTHPDEQVQLIANSIKEFGFKTPIVVDENFVIIQGHGRLKASHSLGLKTVPCIVADELSKEQVKMLRLADNKVAESEWDLELLDYELIDLSEDFTISDFGFSFGDDEDFTVDLPSGDREPIRNMTFTVSDEQHELIEQVLKDAKLYPLADPAGINENSNGNALYYICEVFKNGLDS